MGKKKTTSLEDIVFSNDDDFIPPHLKRKGIDTALINAAFKYAGNREILNRLWQAMDPGTAWVYWRVLEWHDAQARAMRYAALRSDIAVKMQEIEEAKKRIFPEGAIKSIMGRVNEVYVTYLIKAGLSAEQANSFPRKALLFLDYLTARLSGSQFNRPEPAKPGLYAFTAYPLRYAIRHAMLWGANTKRYDLPSPDSDRKSRGQPS